MPRAAERKVAALRQKKKASAHAAGALLASVTERPTARRTARQP